MPKVLVCGARCRRQGIGAHVARSFAHVGAQICAVVGTRGETVSQACRTLADRYGIACHGYTSLEIALAEEKPDIVALCSPYEFHHEQLKAVAKAKAHCLCEKPMWWGKAENRRTETARLVEAFLEQRRYLALVTQWPYTLPAFYKLYPRLEGQRVERFEMLLSPISQGANAVLDSAPHVISMLQRLVGCGEIRSPQGCFSNDRGELRLNFDFHHRTGITAVGCQFITKEDRPRPAAYAINGFWVERTVLLPEYTTLFLAQGQSIVVDDPLFLLVDDFLKGVEGGRHANRQALMDGITGLECLVNAVSSVV